MAPKISKGLFDPRQRSVAWPEPSDDPNIPYVWGLGRYTSNLGEPATNETNSVLIPTPEIPKDASSSNPRMHSEDTSKLVISSLIVLGIYGAVEGFNETSGDPTKERIYKSLIKGAKYATGVGFVAEILTSKD